MSAKGVKSMNECKGCEKESMIAADLEVSIGSPGVKEKNTAVIGCSEEEIRIERVGHHCVHRLRVRIDID